MSGNNSGSDSSAGPDATLAYGHEHPDQVADITLPLGPVAGPVPLVLFLHGGFWRARHDRLHAGALAEALAGQGYLVANVEYRRVGAGGGWPATFTDVALAADTLPGLIEAAYPGRVDHDRVVHCGHSAGGHLVLWAAARTRLPEAAPGRTDATPRVAGVVGLGAVTDLAEAWEQGNGEGAVAEFLEGGPDELPDRYAAADPSRLGALPVPTVLVHGEQDQRVPVRMARRYRDDFGAKLVELPDAGHFELIDPASSAWPHVLAAIRLVL
ncbi:lipase [Kitasatospora herbaricolor]|uniref:alpha/beta hydrolase family protein n=1 Tax=Kitasatospora herbaricolor TaxID=68217 RepID=UPI001749F3B3|nr:alpha/beta hydrolase [Kitasatospora herbaricolor]MDQ0313109.1 acetyl esterase/lipase [Kitasatospora herbaricolor]GGV39969.1 lipase [Kitasatospora herbaricolor]